MDPTEFSICITPVRQVSWFTVLKMQKMIPFPFRLLPEWLKETAWNGPGSWPFSVTSGLTLFLDVGGVYFMVFDHSTFSHQIMLTRFSDWASGSKKVLLSLKNQVLAVGGRDGCREGSPPLGFRWLWKLLPMFILIWCFMGTVYRETEIEDPGLWNAAEDPGLWKYGVSCALRLGLSPEAWHSTPCCCCWIPSHNFILSLLVASDCSNLLYKHCE